MFDYVNFAFSFWFRTTLIVLKVMSAIKKMTRVRYKHNVQLTREQLLAINKQHVQQASLLLTHMLEAHKRISELEKELKEIKHWEDLKRQAELKRREELKRQTLLIVDSHERSINHKQIEHELGGQLFSGKAYNSGAWPRAKFPHKSQEKVVPLLLKERPFTDLILQLSCNDISNLDHIQDSEGGNVIWP